MKKNIKPLCGINLMFIRPGYCGGTVRYAHELISNLVGLNCFDLIVYVQKGGLSADDPLRSKVKIYEVKLLRGIFMRVLYEQLVLPFIVMKHRVNLLLSPGFVSPLWGKFKKVVTIHDLYFKKFPKFVRKWQRRYWNIMIPLSIKAVDSIIVISNTTRRDICHYYPKSSNKVQCIYVGVSSDGKVTKDNKKNEVTIKSTPYCLMVGSLTPNKNITIAIKGLEILNNSGMKCNLKIVGEDLFDQLSDYLKNRNLSYSIETLSNISDTELWRLYRSALCMIQASIYEGFGLPVIEAMAHGCPVITSDADVFREIAGGATLEFPVNGADKLAEKIKLLNDDSELKRHLIDMGFKNIKRFRWPDTALCTSQLFEKLLSNS